MKATPKDVRIDAQFKEQADEYLEIMWYEFHDERWENGLAKCLSG